MLKRKGNRVVNKLENMLNLTSCHGKCKLKPQWDIISYPPDWEKWENLVRSSVVQYGQTLEKNSLLPNRIGDAMTYDPAVLFFAICPQITLVHVQDVGIKSL